MLDPDQISVNLWVIHADLARDPVASFARLAERGFRVVEAYDPVASFDSLTLAIRDFGFTVPTVHAPLFGDGLDEIFDAATKLGVECVIAPSSKPDLWSDEANLPMIAERLNAVADEAARHGLSVGYHNHWWELEARFGDRFGLEVLAAHLDPEVVLEVDAYWAYVGGANPVSLVAGLGEAVKYLHLKDGDGTKNMQAQVGAGRGVIPIWDVVAAAPQLRLGIAELDGTEGDLYDVLGQSFDYLTTPATTSR